MIPVKDIQSVAIIGNGLMGQGIAQVFARAGKDVTMIGRSGESLARAMSAISTNFEAFVDRGLTNHDDTIAAISRIRTSTEITDAADADFVIEAVPAVRDLQIQIFRELDAVCAPGTVIGSTSGQPISLMYTEMQHPDRAVAIHFVYPAQLIPVVEICGGPKTRADVVQWSCDLMQAIGQVPAPMNNEVDGFIINRLQFAILREAWSMWADGIASAEAIDNSFKMTLGRRYSVTGPIESADMGGLDIMNMFGEFLLPALYNDDAPPAALRALPKAGHFGLKSGKGVYDWSQRDGKARLAARADRLFQHMAEDAAQEA